jgi:hypothetical protein
VILTLLSITPLFAQVQHVPQAVTEEEVRVFLNEYTDVYMKMDLDRFINLFSKDAVENRMYAYDDIYQGYKKQFRVSKTLKYQLFIFSINAYARSAYVSGRYIMNQTLKGWGRSKVYKGDIQFGLVRENGSLKIREINYGISR